MKNICKKTGMVTVVQTETFLKTVKDYFPKDEYLNELITYLANNPEAGDVIEETHGWRKLRWVDKVRNIGTRGGYRVFYIYKSELQEVWLLTTITKTKKKDLSKNEKKDIEKKA